MGMDRASDKPVVLVSSTVYGFGELLSRVYPLLTAFGYEVWMSHKGTMPVRSELSAFENCLLAVDRCDLFLGIITPNYGTGVDASGLSITHKEILRAIETNKPRWLLSHSHVVFARRFLRDLGYESQDERAGLALKKGAKSIDDMRVIDLYEEGIHSTANELLSKGNWVQEYETDEDALLFAAAQFSRYQEVESFLEENFANKVAIRTKLDGIGEAQE
jgi:Domain of unknown function (DUF4062)